MPLEITFWILAFVVFYTYLGYGILIWLIVFIKDSFYSKDKREKSPFIAEFPSVTLLIAAYNEEDVIEDKMNNILSLDYPADKLNVLWVTDGSTDRTMDKLGKYTNIKILYEPERKGKTAAINRAVAYVDTPIIIFTDANAILNVTSIKEIVSAFTEKSIGCVAGEKRIIIDSEDAASSSGEGFYWRYESFLKQLDSCLYSVVGAAGELYAIRNELFEHIPNDTILDDLVLSLKIAQKGYTITYCPQAYAIEYSSDSMKEEEKRKVRIAAGGLQAVWRLRALLNIVKYRTLSFQYISHRVLRWTITPIALFVLFPLNIAIYSIASSENIFLYGILLFLQCLFYLSAFTGYLYSQKEIKHKIFFVPYYFMFMNLNVLKAYNYLLHKGNIGIWEKVKRKSGK